MIKRITILTLTTICIFYASEDIYAQEGEFGKKNQQRTETEETTIPQTSESQNSESKEVEMQVYPHKVIKSSGDIGKQERKEEKSTPSQSTVKEKDQGAKNNKHNLFFYYLYKFKYDESESKDNTVSMIY